MSSLILLRAVLAKHLHNTGFLQPAGNAVFGMKVQTLPVWAIVCRDLC